MNRALLPIIKGWQNYNFFSKYIKVKKNLTIFLIKIAGKPGEGYKKLYVSKMCLYSQSDIQYCK